MQNKRSFKDKVFLVLKGLAMGAANKVPGVSGGIVAFVAGFYEEFIYSLQKFNRKALLLLYKKRYKSFLNYVNASFLGLLVLGMVISYFSVSKLLDYFLLHYELYVWSGFFGMIIGSIFYIAKDFKVKSLRHVLFIILGLLVGGGISLLEPATENDNLWFVFFCGVIGVSGMTLPGLSGSFILILVGNYVLLLVDSVNALFDTLKDLASLNLGFLKDQKRVHLLKILTSFTAGSLVGLVSLSHLLGYVLKHYKNITFATIIGFITGSLGVVWPWKEKVYKIDMQGQRLIDANGNFIIDNYNRYLPDFQDTQNYIAVAFIFLGVILVYGLGLYGANTKNLK
ncbi:DUF368 domain-containing protein [Mesonia sediminis]|uniref:DUF368 domain-containing protein n=1 Tax=Mesonia sediminis TaxID=1703946 RepID=A0ABW5SBQ4_9FLAO